MTGQRPDPEEVIREWLAGSVPDRAPASLKAAVAGATSRPAGHARPWPRAGWRSLRFAGRVAVAVAILAVAGTGAYFYGNFRATAPTAPSAASPATASATASTTASATAFATGSATASVPTATYASPSTSNVTLQPEVTQLLGSNWRLVSGALPAPALTAYGWYEQPFFALPSGGFVALRPMDSGDNRVFLSADGISWTELARLPSGGATVTDVTKSGGTIVAVGLVMGNGPASDSAVAWTMSDGHVWHAIALSPEDGSAANHVAAGPAGFLVSGTGPGGFAVWASTDGMAWHSVVSSGVPSDVDQPVLFGTTTGYVIVQFAQPRVWHSTDGTRWTETYHAPTLSGLSMYYMGPIVKAPDGSYRSFGGIYTGTGIAVPGPVNRLIWTSPNMTSWTMSSGVKDPGSIDGFASASAGFVMAGTQPNSSGSSGGLDQLGPLGVWTSSDGRSWKPLPGLSSLPDSHVLAVVGDGTRVVIAVVDQQGNLQLVVGGGTS
jgi:hypothetical protein